MLTLSIEPEIELRLEALGASTDESKLELLRRALLEALEDLEDIRLADQVLSRPQARFTLDEVEREFGLAD